METLKQQLEEIFERLIPERVDIISQTEFNLIIVFQCIERNQVGKDELFEVIYSKTLQRFLTCNGDDYIRFWEDANNI